MEGGTAVLFASLEKNFENLDILVKALGADVDLENKFTLTPLMSCLEYDLYESCAKTVKAWRRSIEGKPPRTSRHVCRGEMRLEIVHLVLTKGFQA